ncbi:MAG TPA: hypothetical protein VFE47_25625, partial [Tepidisphaeraceae bacterium]|nr:hypothetical protein [Tepidisphaeraceae bacterium]
DIIPWLSPDWVLDMATQTLTRGRIAPPRLQLQIRRCDRDMWPLFRRHHYLSGNLHRAARCYLGSIESRPAVFTAVLPFPHPKRPGWREHRLVCLPDFQGIGIGAAMSAYIASLYVATGKPYFSTSGHPAVVQSRANSPLWKMIRKPGLASRCGKAGAEKTGMRKTLSEGRFTAGFEYVGAGKLTEAEAFGVAVG